MLSNIMLGQHINFTTLTTKSGLSSNTINGILKDRYGLMWFATADGLNRYDGSTFTVYRHHENDPSSFPANEIMCLFEDKEGRLWIGSAEGALILYDRLHDKFKAFTGCGFGKSVKSETIRAIAEDHRGRLWVSSYTGLWVIDFKANKTSLFTLNSIYPNSETFVTALSLYEDSKQTMWVGTSAGLLRYDEKRNQFERYLHDERNPSSLSSNVIKAIKQDPSGTLWLGTTNGLNQLNKDGRSFSRVALSSEKSVATGNIIYSLAADGNELWIGTEDGLAILNTRTLKSTLISPQQREMFSISDKSIRSIFIDKKGIYWLGTYQGGVDKFDKNLTLFNHKVSNPFDAQGLQSPMVTSFAQYDGKNVFVGTDNGGVQLFNTASGLFRSFTIRPANSSSDRISVLALKYARDGKLWIGTYRQGVFILDPRTGNYQQVVAGEGKNHISQNDIFCIEEDPAGRIWIGTNGGGIDIYDPVKKGFANYENIFVSARKLGLNNFIRAIAVGNNNEMWVGTSGAGVTVFNLTTGKVTQYNEWNSKLNSNVVNCILRDTKGQMWLGTAAGAAVFSPDKKHVSTYSEKDGLTNNVVHKILEDNQGLFWMTTNAGISNFNPATKKFNTFSRQNGVQDSPFNTGSGIRTADGHLFFGGNDGFNYFDPADLRSVKDVPPVMFTELRVANNKVYAGENSPISKQISLAKEIKLAYGQNFSISYVAVNYTNAHQDQYAYMLKGFDRDWNNVGKATTAYYTNIDPGTYTFMVRASNSAGVWSQTPTEVTVRILPPWWRTIYAYLAYFAFGLALLLYIRHRGIKKIKQELALEEEKREANRMHELDMAKINFLTNLSHEFRTPISLIMAPADKLLAMQTDKSVSREVTMINRNARRLLNLVNQLLDFRKMEEHELRLNLSEGDVVEFIREAVNSFQDLSERKKIALKFSSEINGYFANFDHDKIERIIFNLLSNAFKFTPSEGSIAVQLSAAKTTDDRDALKVIISDTGIGIPADQQQHIFKRFYQHDTSEVILNQGTGIGLSITKEFVELQGGTIALESEPGKGTTFTLVFPFENIAATAPGINEPAEAVGEKQTESIDAGDLNPVAAQEQESVLLVEDNDDFRFYLKESLKGQYRIYEASNGKEGWQKALSCHPDLIVTDISMPHMNGIDLCRKLKSDKRTSFIPVIVLTALTGEQDQLRGLETGASDYLNKPFNFSVLSAKVANLIKINRNLRTTFSKQIQIIQPEVQIDSPDEKLLSKVAQFVDEKLNDPEFSIEELSKYLAMSRSSLYNKIFELTGLAPVEYVRSIKLQKAAVLLAKSQYTIREIAFMTGFGTPGYFSKLFKAKYNMSPSEYLNSKRNGAKAKTEVIDD
ncbi:ATP-binding protein [Mucilaginibacter sp. RS28]|uniref:histidine kinase n=1 Tax=Mucilaginibacter straminoryzae TaxID=2932774 RepID=A0A9X1X289_9SPHI|nr:two-component regulator propeller domain-containing protein [Mucilaginibacter straminoryzae]MCJ8208615.1 ATP-binding protein [Mucilaginibacter straminoryzae]